MNTPLLPLLATIPTFGLLLSIFFATTTTTLPLISSSSSVNANQNPNNFIFFPHSKQQKQLPNLSSRLTIRGVEFFGLIGHKLVNKELPKTKFPLISLPIDGGPGSGEVNVTELHIPPTLFESPKFRFQLSPPSAIKFVSSGGTVPVRGLWSAFYWLAGIKFWANGWVELVADDIDSALLLGAGHSKEKPQLEVFSCSANVDKIEVQIGGGVIPWLVNLFRAQLSSALKEAIHDEFCLSVRSTLLGQLNNLLLSMPSTFPIGDLLYLNYAFDVDPEVSSSFIQTSLLTDVLVENNSVLCPLIPSSPIQSPQTPSKQWMMNVWIHSSVPNCLLWSLHGAQLLQLTIGPEFAGGKLALYLQTSCHIYQICLGRVFPKLSLEYAGQHVDFHLHSMVPPFLRFVSLQVEKTDASSFIVLDAKFFVDFHISPWKSNPKVLARLEANGTADVKPFFFNGQIKGSLENLKVNFSEVYSSIGNFSKAFLRTFSLLSVPFLEAVFRSALRVGFPLPSLENIRLANGSELTVLPKSEQLRLDANLEYAIGGNLLGREINFN